MEVVDALRTLGLGADASWQDVRQAYRDQLMAHHPDRAGAGASSTRTEAVIEAFRALRTVTDDGTRALPLSVAIDPDDADAPMVLHARPGDVFVRLYQAAERLGHVSYADRDANLLQVTIGGNDWAPAQLTAELSSDAATTTVMFSLEPITTAAAPPIVEVVRRLADELRAPATIDGPG